MKKVILIYILFNILLFIALLYFFFAKKEDVKNIKSITQVYEITGSTFDLPVILISTEDTAWCRVYIKHNFNIQIESTDFDCRGFTLPTIDGKPVIIWLPNLNDESVLNHELLHATISIMQWADIPLNDETEEVYCYQLQFLINELKNKRGTF
jgi:hypothetical protein